MPTTRPRRATNQRLATVAPSTLPAMPVPMPLSAPQKRLSCHSVVIRALAIMLAQISAIPPSITQPRAEAIDQPAGQRADQPEQQQADRYRERDRRQVPAHVGLQRVEKHARRRAHAGRDQQRQRRHADDDPAVVEAIADQLVHQIAPRCNCRLQIANCRLCRQRVYVLRFTIDNLHPHPPQQPEHLPGPRRSSAAHCRCARPPARRPGRPAAPGRSPAPSRRLCSLSSSGGRISAVNTATGT